MNSMAETAQTARQLLSSIRDHCDQYGHLHRTACEKYARRATRLTMANVFASVMILFIAANEGAQDFVSAVVKKIVQQIGIGAEFAKNADLGELAIGVFGAIAVFTAAMQYLLKYEERNLIHKYVAADYENLQRKIGRFLAKEVIEDYDVHRINKQLNFLVRHSPPLSKSVTDNRPWWRRVYCRLIGC